MEVVWEPSYIISSWVFKCTSVNLVWVWAYDFVLKATRIGTDRYMSLWSELCECAQRYLSVCSEVKECVHIGIWVCAQRYMSVCLELCECVIRAMWVSAQSYTSGNWYMSKFSKVYQSYLIAYLFKIKVTWVNIN